jgi:hypothetical protein
MKRKSKRTLLTRRIKHQDHQPTTPKELSRLQKPASTPLIDRTLRGRTSNNYVAMTRYGWGVHKNAYDALLLCADKLPENLHKKPVQVVFYVVADGVEPEGIDKWSNGDKPRLVGLLALNRKGTR